MSVPDSRVSVERQGWWSQPSAAWDEAKDEAYEVFRQHERAKVKLSEVEAQAALAFGFQGRLAHADEDEWSGLIDRLELDWSAAGSEVPWARARPAVKAGWTQARQAALAQEQARLDLQQARLEAHEDHRHDPVPGGRLSDHGV